MASHVETGLHQRDQSSCRRSSTAARNRGAGNSPVGGPNWCSNQVVACPTSDETIDVAGQTLRFKKAGDMTLDLPVREEKQPVHVAGRQVP